MTDERFMEFANMTLSHVSLELFEALAAERTRREKAGAERDIYKSDCIIGREQADALRDRVTKCHEHTKQLLDYIYFLLTAYSLWSEEDTFTFPDGNTIHKDEQV